MPLTIKKPTGGKLVKGRDHYLQCQLTWDDGTHPDLTASHFYVTMKESDLQEDEDAIMAFNSEDNGDQFIVVDNSTGELDVWFKKEDQDDIVPNITNYCTDLVVILSDGTEWPFILDYNLVFAQPITRKTNHTV
jgi:hypothetical protein